MISTLPEHLVVFISTKIRTNRRGLEEMTIIAETVLKQKREEAITIHSYGGNNACAYIKRVEQRGDKY